MAKFNIATDVKVEILTPGSTNMVWNLDWWDNAKWGATDTSTWVDLAAEVYDLQMEEGFDLENNAYFAPIATSVTIKLRTTENNPDLNTRIRLGAKIRVKVKLISGSSLYQEVFYGKIDSFDNTYNPNEEPLLTLFCLDYAATWLATPLVAFSAPAEPVLDRITRLGTVMSTLVPELDPIVVHSWATDNNPTLDAVPSGTTTFLEQITPIMLIGLGSISLYSTSSSSWFYMYDESVFTPYYGLVVTNEKPVETGNNQTVTYNTLEISVNSANIVNYCTINSSAGVPLGSAVSNDAVTMYGIQEQQITLPITNQVFAENLANRLIARQNTKSATFEIDGRKRIDGSLNLVPQQLNSVRPHKYAITQKMNGLNKGFTAFAKRTTHSINTDGWFTTIETWKG